MKDMNDAVFKQLQRLLAEVVSGKRDIYEWRVENEIRESALGPYIKNEFTGRQTITIVSMMCRNAQGGNNAQDTD